METVESLEALLQNSTYPGRGIVLGRHSDGRHAVLCYFIMGRSENSRNRVFVPQGAGLRTQAFDPAKLTDPSLILYSPVRVLGEGAPAVTVVTNGDQTDTVVEGLAHGGTFAAALRTRTFEPDAPNYTPRISGLLQGFDYRLSILKSAGGDPSSTRRFFYEYDHPMAGQGHFIHTYRCDGDPLPSFEGEPIAVTLSGTLDDFTQRIWQSLDARNKVSLFTRWIDVETGAHDSRIINKNQA